ncbi:uncharacterized protein A4U43_C02F4870 [Asparagus officinalis]|uniref:Uncharacterized protein n=1 Tax=Asparagus officinalis TaxID=4686 RepID=A0A5P1FFX8_ASPOF|nr:uncharacterized protein A4U43_C02F4870 [Asparagus officinalis]
MHLATEIIPRRNTKLLAILLIIRNPLIHSGRRLPTALNSTIDGSDRSTEPLTGNNDLVHVSVEPVPESRLEGDDVVVADGLGAVEAVESDALAGGAVVVVPGDLEWAPAEVLLAGVAGPLRFAWVAVVVGCAVDLVYVAEVCMQEKEDDR